MLYKFIDENTVEEAPRWVKETSDGEEYITSNPPEETLKALGYKELVDTPQPETDDGYTRTFTYADGDVITKVWSEPIADTEGA